jgi:two-component system invasion response regulator UvrY
MPTVLIADDHAVVRAGLRQFLAEDRSITQVGEAGTGSETLEMLRAARWDLVILDIGMPDRSGLDVLRQIRAEHPESKVLVISGYPERQYALNVLRAGASGFLAKTSAADDLLKAVNAVLQGRRYVSATLAELLLSDIDGNSDQPIHSKLSEREFQIFTKLAGGQAVSEIAGELGLSVKTISTYRTRILEKMSLRTNADLTSYALRNGIIQ